MVSALNPGFLEVTVNKNSVDHLQEARLLSYYSEM
jgi:hypothetical protein